MADAEEPEQFFSAHHGILQPEFFFALLVQIVYLQIRFARGKILGSSSSNEGFEDFPFHSWREPLGFLAEEER